MVTVNLGAGGGDAPVVFDAEVGVALRDAVYLKSNGKVDKADASAEATMPAFGFVAALLPANQVEISTEKVLEGFSGLTIAAPLYVSETAGELTATPPDNPGTVIQEVALAIAADKILIKIDTDSTVNA